MDSPTARPFPMGEREFVVMMALLQALQALAIDAMLPALGVISSDLGEHGANQRQLVIGVFLVCSGFASLFPGALADRFGRRRVLLVCVGAYVLFNLAAALAPSFTALLAMRGAAGLFSSGMLVVTTATIRDRFSGDRMARVQSLCSVIFMIVPMAAPALGQAVMLFAGWREIFALMTGLGAAIWLWVFFRLPETLHPEFRQRIDPAAIAGNMRTALTTRASIGYILSMALVQSAMFGYLNSSQQLVAEHFGMGEYFPLVFGGMALIMACTSLTNSRIVMRFGARRVSHTAVIVYIVLATAQLLMAGGAHETFWEFMPIMTLNLCLIGFIGANFQAIALQPFARIAGAASSLQAFVRLMTGSVLGALIGQAYDGTARPLAMALLAAGIGTLLLVLYSENGRLFRRLHGQVPQA